MKPITKVFVVFAVMVAIVCAGYSFAGPPASPPHGFTVSGSATYTLKQVKIYQPADSVGLDLYGYDDKVADYIKIYIGSTGASTIATSGTALTISSYSLFLNPTSYVHIGSASAIPVFICAGGGQAAIGTDTVVTGAKTTVEGSIYQNSTETHAAFGRKVYSGSANITNTTSVTINLAHAGSGTTIPAEEKIVGVYLHVKAALADGETWDADLDDGAQVLALASGAAVAVNTNVPLVDVTGVKTDATTNIVIYKNSNPGVDSFTAQGTIEAVVITEGWAAWANES